jgi:DNA (cytosine-5)-methyltransferase 1
VPEVFGLVTDREREILEALLLLRRRERRRPVGDADPVSARSLSNLIKRPVANDLASLLRKGYVRRVATYFDLTHTFNGKYRRLAWDAPSLTVDTRFGDYRYFLHPDDDRGFTVREVARIQAFPDSYSFFTQDRQAYTMIGNAVPPPMARCIARLVRTRLLAPQGR